MRFRPPRPVMLGLSSLDGRGTDSLEPGDLPWLDAAAHARRWDVVPRVDWQAARRQAITQLLDTVATGVFQSIVGVGLRITTAQPERCWRDVLELASAGACYLHLAGTALADARCLAALLRQGRPCPILVTASTDHALNSYLTELASGGASGPAGQLIVECGDALPAELLPATIATNTLLCLSFGPRAAADAQLARQVGVERVIAMHTRDERVNGAQPFESAWDRVAASGHVGLVATLRAHSFTERQIEQMTGGTARRMLGARTAIRNAGREVAC